MAKRKVSTDPSKVEEIPEGMSYVRHPLELLVSPAWTGQSINLRRLIDRLEIEHLRHRGLENGRLVVTYDQFQQAGIGRRLITETIREGETRGLIEAMRGGFKAFHETYVSRYRLTYLKSVAVGDDGATYYHAPTNEWRKYRAPTKEKNSTQGHEDAPEQFTKVNSTGSPSCTAEPAEPAEARGRPTVHESEPTIISRPPEDDPPPSSESAAQPGAPEAYNSRSARRRPNRRPGGGVDARQIDLEDLLGGSYPDNHLANEIHRAHPSMRKKKVRE